MTAELISVGTEILLGNIVNTNANYLARKCAELGIAVYYQVTVGDNEGRLLETIDTALSRSDIVILTGGLGPTQDDLTKETVAKVIGRKLLMDEHSSKRIEAYFNYRKQNQIPDNNWKQALKIENSMVIDNDNGTAPGYIVEHDGKRIIILPGPPNELIPMFEERIYPYLSGLQTKVYHSVMVKICGIGESRAEKEIIDLIEKQDNPTIAPYAKSGEVHLRITASASDRVEASRMIKPVLEEIRKRFGDCIYTTAEEETLESVVVDLLKRNHYTVTFAESCTGGLIAGRLINVPGASEVLNEAFITYSNGAKMRHLGVKEETLRAYGAVSEETAREMAYGAARLASSDTALAVTGIAGPGGGTIEKPVGLVYVSCFVKGQTFVRELRFMGDRQKIREQTVTASLDLLRRSILTSL